MRARLRRTVFAARAGAAHIITTTRRTRPTRRLLTQFIQQRTVTPDGQRPMVAAGTPHRIGRHQRVRAKVIERRGVGCRSLLRQIRQTATITSLHHHSATIVQVAGVAHQERFELQRADPPARHRVDLSVTKRFADRREHIRTASIEVPVSSIARAAMRTQPFDEVKQPHVVPQTVASAPPQVLRRVARAGYSSSSASYTCSSRSGSAS